MHVLDTEINSQTVPHILHTLNLPPRKTKLFIQYISTGLDIFPSKHLSIHSLSYWLKLPSSCADAVPLGMGTFLTNIVYINIYSTSPDNNLHPGDYPHCL